MSMQTQSLFETIHNAFTRCLFTDDELLAVDGAPRTATFHKAACEPETIPAPDGAPHGAVLVQGITASFGLHPERLEEARPIVADAIRRMHPNFRPAPKGGGGWSFLNLCETADGEQWAEQMTMQELVVLAIGLRLGKIMMPRAMWPMFPGGMPYVVLDDEAV